MNADKSRQEITNLFHDCGYIYLSTIEPAIDEPITVRLRTEKGNVTKAYVEISHNGIQWMPYEMQLEKEDATGYFEYFIGTIPGQKEMFKYRFHVENDNPDNEVYCGRTYIGKEPITFDEKSLKADNCWVLIPGYHAPDWAKGVLWYSIMPDAFYNGDITNDEPISGNNQSNAWNMPQHTLQNKYGGDLLGIQKKLDYIKELGCEAVFMNPIFKASQNACYGTEFFDQIENSLGNRQAFADLAKAIHDKGLYYMIDVVLTFVAQENTWFDSTNRWPLPGAMQDWDSEYHDFFHWTGEKGEMSAYVPMWGGAKLNNANDHFCDLIYRNEDSYLQYYCKEPFCPDGIRYDCGGWLKGKKKDGTEWTSTDVLGDMRPYLRNINPEIMLLSEYSMYYGMDKGVWDSRWHLAFAENALKYMKGELTESFIYMRMEEEMHNIPRAMGHCQYNSMEDHDRPRIRDVEPWAYRAYQLIHMTEIGSPCIYYGGEVRMAREGERLHSSFYSMEWNEANWDYEALNDTRALTELRKNYSALRTGIVKYLCVDDEEHILAFARMDEASTVITVASRNEVQKELAISVRELSEVDGTVFTDWLTGKQYVAKDGYIDVMLPAGGTIFVKGEQSASYKGGFAVVSKGEKDPLVTVPKEHTISIGGKDVFVYRDVFNICEISALYKEQEGSGMLQIRADQSDACAWIGAEICENTIRVYAKKTKDDEVESVVFRRIPANSYVKLVRQSDNTFAVYITRVPGWKWEKVVSGIHVDIPNHAKAGMTATKGAATFDNIKVKYTKESILCDDFTNGKSAMFDFTPDMNITYGESGMTLIPNSGDVRLLTNAYDEDWTFQSEFVLQNANEGEFAGVISQQDEDIYVVAGRMRRNGQPIFFVGRASAGKLVVYHAIEDGEPERKAVVQLQRIGTTYSAVYSYDGKNWSMIGRDVIANMCRERAGLIVNGEHGAVFTYACFGNAIRDGLSYNTPHTPMEIKTNFVNINDTMIQPSYRIVSGEWNYAHEGYIQKSKDLAQMGISNKVYTDFKVDGTYVIDEGEGFVGFEFAKCAYDSELGDGILFQLDSQRKISVVQGAKVLAEEQLPECFGNEIKLSVENRHGNFIVFAGQNGEPVLELHDFAQTRGYIAYYMKGVIGHVNNFLTASYDAECYYNAQYEILPMKDGVIEKNWLHTTGFVNAFGAGVTDFIASAEFHVKEFGDKREQPFVGFQICSPEAKFTKNKAIAVGFGMDEKMVVKNGDDILQSVDMEHGKESRKIMVVKKDGKITVFVDGAKEALIECLDATPNGGVVSLFASKAAVTFKKFMLENLNADEQPEDTEIFKNWLNEI